MVGFTIGLILGFFVGLISATHQILRMEDREKDLLKEILDNKNKRR